MQTRNLGTLDRTLRIVLGVALQPVFVGPQTLWGLIGLVPLVTGVARFCPAYGLAGVTTCAATSGPAHTL
jgi:hypothetical protein